MLSSLALGALTLFCMTRPCVLKHVKKCIKHIPKMHIIVNINPRAVYVAFCNEFMSLQAVALASVCRYIFRQHRLLFHETVIFYTLVRPIFTHAEACVRSPPQEKYCHDSTEYDRHQATFDHWKCDKSLSNRHCSRRPMSA